MNATQVIVVGAGPTGLMLAGELRLGGAAVTVIEKREERSWESRGIGVTARAAELLEQRGLLARLPDAQVTTAGHFGGIPLDYAVLDGGHFGVRGVPQYRIEEMLEGWASELGARVMRGCEVTSLDDRGDHVELTVRGPSGTAELSADYVVGCDGGHSTVRTLGGFAFVGRDAEREMYLADVGGCDIAPRMIGELLPNGMVMAAPLEQGFTRIIVCETGVRPTRGRVVTFEAVADAWQRLTGESIHGGTARWVSSFGDATRQATQYRRGRVLLAGDAAHIHLPAGGQGMSIGLQDAVNLAWKLAATVGGRAPAGLLDTYHADRHPVGERVLRNTRAQGTLNLTGTPVEPMRAVLAELMELPAVARHLVGMVTGFDIRYDVGIAGHPALGRRFADRTVELRDGRRVPTAELFRSARGVLLTTTDSIARAAAGWADRVDVVLLAAEPEAAESVLIRPDGYVAWVAPHGGDLAAALRRWFGAPGVVPHPDPTPALAAATTGGGL